MECYLDDHYPSHAAYGEDFFTGASQGDIIEEGPDGPVVRREKVLITDRDLDYEGRVCVGERTVRHFAHVLGMVDEWRIQRVKVDNIALRNELVELSMALAHEREQNRRLRAMEDAPPVQVFLALDDSEHTSRRAAWEASRVHLGVESAILTDASPKPVETEVVP